MSKKVKVFVGLSGGVDSSVSAALLKQRGYDVTGVYMKNWSQDLPGFKCPWKEDYLDAKRVAVQLGIPLLLFDFEKQYRRKVVEYMLDGFKSGITPNPDIMCNQEIKFKLFLETALEQGADMIATGHYALLKPLNAPLAVSAELDTLRGSRRSALSEALVLASSTNLHNSLRASLHPSSSSESVASSKKQGLFMAKDGNKDQTYFLYRVTENALQKTIFPLGEYTKPQVRKMAKKFGLATADKKDSMGICFVGQVGIKEFLNHFVKTKPGEIIDQHGQIIGHHEGAIFYTIGQRHGLNIGGGLPYYVVGKNMATNQVMVSSDISDNRLWSNKLTLTALHWINPENLQLALKAKNLAVRVRHQADFIDVKKIKKLTNSNLEVQLAISVKALTPGQSAVFYSDDLVLGGGIMV